MHGERAKNSGKGRTGSGERLGGESFGLLVQVGALGNKVRVRDLVQGAVLAENGVTI